MFKEGNQIVVKAAGEPGFIYDTTAYMPVLNVKKKERLSRHD